MTTVLFVQPVAERGGSDHALLRLVRSLPSDEFRCHIALPGPAPMEAEFEAAGATLHVVPMRRITTSGDLGWWVRYALGWPVAILRLLALARRTRADVICSNSLHSWYGWAVAAVLRLPHVWCAREVVTQSATALRLERFLARHFATVLLAMSQAIADQFDSPNVETLAEMPDPQQFAPSRAGSFRAGHGMADGAPTAGFLGRIDTWKGVDVLIDAAAQLRSQRPDADVVVGGPAVAGKEAYAARLESAARDVGVRWLGQVADPAGYLADLDVAVVPSTEPEPYGLVVVEALASGVPVVATDAGGPPEILRRAGEDAGALVPPGESRALAKAIAAELPMTTSAADRRSRPRLLDPVVMPYADVFRRVVP